MVDTAVGAVHLPESLLLGIEAAGIAMLLGALSVARAGLVVPAVVVVAIPDGAAVALGGSAQLAPVLGALLLAAGELAFWSIEKATPARESAQVGLSRAVWLVGLCLAGCIIGLLITAISDLPVTGGFDLTALGVLAAIGIAALLLWLGRDAIFPGISDRP